MGDVALEVTVSSVKSTDVTCKTHSGWLVAQLPWLVNLASLVCDMDCRLRYGASARQSVVAGSISRGGDHGIHCRWDLMRSKNLSSVSVCRTWVFVGFSCHGSSIQIIYVWHISIKRIWHYAKQKKPLFINKIK